LKKALLLLLAGVFVLTECAAGAEAKTLLSIATGGVAGVYYPLGGALAQLINGHLADVEVTAELGDASAANIDLIAGHEVKLALVQNDVAFRALKGEKPFKEPVKNLQMIASLYPEHIQCVTTRAGGVETLADLKGKRVSVGAPGSGTTDSVGTILIAAGIKYSEINADFLDFAATAERIQDGRLDAGFVVAGYPTPAVMALAARQEIDLVAFDDDVLSRLVKAYPFFTKDVVPAGTYSGVDHDTPTPAVLAVLVCDAELPEDLVYDITKAIFDNLAELEPVHDKTKLIALDKALDAAAAPVHPGAAKYYTEKGLEVPTF
jgi:TRAP transporter TAXI family solute receptor